MKIVSYAVYDMQDNGICTIIGKSEDVSKWLKITIHSMYCAVLRKSLVSNRYLVEKI